MELIQRKGILLQVNKNFSIQSEKTTFRVFEKNSSIPSYYFLPILQSDSYEKAVDKAKQLVDTTFKNSDLSVYLQEKQSGISILVGPFSKKTEIDFVKKNLYPYFACQETLQILSDQSFACMEIEKRILFMSPLYPTNQNSIVFLLSNQDRGLSFEGTTYPDNILLFLCKNQTLSVVNQTDIETYLLGVVPSEMPDDWNLEALKAQSVVSRTYAFSRLIQARKTGSYFDVTDDTTSQVYMGKRISTNSPGAIQSTKGLILAYNNRPIDAVFHSTSGGYTENNDKIWNGTPFPYLRAMPSPGEEISPHFSWCFRFSLDTFIAKLNEYLIQEKKKPIQGLQSIKILEKGESPRVRKIEVVTDLGSIVLSGSTFQQIYSLKSTWFEFLISDLYEHQALPPLLGYFSPYGDKTTDKNIVPTVYIYGRGWGHGVGMSQYGALAQAKKGAKYEEIIHNFFGNVSIDPLENYLPSQQKVHSLATCNLMFSPEEIKIKTNEFKDLIIKITTSQAVFGITFDLTYPKNILSIPLEEIREGTFLRAGGKHVIFQTKESEYEVKVVLTREGKESGGVSGGGDLLFLRMKGISVGTGKIEIKNLKVLDAQLNFVFSDSSPCLVEGIEPDVTPPKTQITSYPDRITNKKLVYFEWMGIDDQALSQELTYSYRLNDEPWSPYSKEVSHYFSMATDGNYLFFVKSRDLSGNEDPFPPSYSFTIDLTPPRVQVFDYPEKTSLKQITLSGICETGAMFLINGRPIPLQADGQFTYSASLDIGKNIFRLIAIDQASNTTTKDVEIERMLNRTVVIYMTVGSLKAQINDQMIIMEVAPILRNSRTLVPLRFIAEAFGATILWNPLNQQIDINLQTVSIKHKIILWIGNKKALLDSVEYVLETAPITLPPGRTVVPLRFIAEAFESSVDWQPLTRSIKITFPSNKIREYGMEAKEFQGGKR